MSMIKCPECGKEVSDKADECPNCGNPISEKSAPKHKSKKKIIVIILIILLISIVTSIKTSYDFAARERAAGNASCTYYTHEIFKKN